MSSTKLVAYSANGREREWVELMRPALELAKQVVDTAFVPKGLRGNGPGIVAAILYGDELGLGPMQALSKIAVIDGKPTLAAETQRALILAAGHEIWVEEATNTRVTISGRRSGSDRASSITWTMEDAKRAGLAGRPAYRGYPRQMLTARATAELARLIFADAIGGLAATEELEDAITVEEEAQPERSATRRRRERTSQPETSARPEPQAKVEAEEPPLPDEPFAVTNDIEFGSEPVPVEDGEPEKPLSLAQTKTKLNALVGQLRDAGKLTTEQLYAALASDRRLNVEDMIALVSGRDEQGELHWRALRDSLELEEARALHARLARYWVNVQGQLEVNA